MKKDKVRKLLTDMTGFVKKITLGVPGTLSQGRERAEDMKDYYKLGLDLEQEKKLMAERHSYDVKLNNMRSSSSGGRSSGSPSTNYPYFKYG